MKIRGLIILKITWMPLYLSSYSVKVNGISIGFWLLTDKGIHIWHFLESSIYQSTKNQCRLTGVNCRLSQSVSSPLVKLIIRRVVNETSLQPLFILAPTPPSLPGAPPAWPSEPDLHWAAELVPHSSILPCAWPLGVLGGFVSLCVWADEFSPALTLSSPPAVSLAFPLSPELADLLGEKREKKKVAVVQTLV